MLLSKDEKLLISAGGERNWQNGRVIGLKDLAVHVWDLRKGKEKYRLIGHHGLITAAALSSDQRWLLTGGFDATRVWNLTTGK